MSDAMPAIALRAQELGVRRQDAWVLRDVGLTLAAGRWTAIVGPNGAGKSTLLQALAGLLPAEGRVELLGRALADWPRRELARQLAWLGQDEAAPLDLSAYDTAMLGRVPHQGWLGAESAADHAAVRQALEETGAWAWRARPLARLSGGERQRVLLARALAVQAPVLLMDEPLANLDPPHQADWMGSVRRRVAAGGTVVSVLHELGVALHADDIVVLDAGRLLHQGGARDDATLRAVEAVFGQRIGIARIGGQPVITWRT